MEKKSFLKIFFPMLLSFATGRLVMQTDLLMVSHLSESATAAFAIPNRAMFLDFIIAFSMAPVISVLVARGGNQEFSAFLIRRVLFMICALAVLATVLNCLVAQWIVTRLAPDPLIAGLAYKAGIWLAAATPFRVVEICGSMILYSLGLGGQLVFLDLIQLLANGALNYLFIYKFHMGFEGSYLGTFLISGLSGLVILMMIQRRLPTAKSWLEVPQWIWAKTFLRDTGIEAARLFSSQAISMLSLAVISVMNRDAHILGAYSVMQAIQFLLLAPMIAVMRSTAILSSSAGGTSAGASLYAQFIPIAKWGIFLLVPIAVLLISFRSWIGCSAYGMTGRTLAWWLPYFTLFSAFLPIRFLGGVQRGIWQSRKKFDILFYLDAGTQWLIAVPVLCIGLAYQNPWASWSGLLMPEMLVTFMLFGLRGRLDQKMVASRGIEPRTNP